ncbi:MAG: hypothetical protein AB7I41_05765 [Candidatus Sericytochromatia bacterium]
MQTIPEILLWLRRALRSVGLWALAVVLLNVSATPLWAASVIPAQDTVAVVDFSAGPEGQLCARSIRQELVRSQLLNVWPGWYTRQRLANPDSQNWQALLKALPEVQSLILGDVQREADRVTVNVIVAHSGPEPALIFAEVAKDRLAELEPLCRGLAAQILGTSVETPLQSPGLSASLSLIMPGAGHFYQGKPLNILLGAGFLSGYLALAYLGFSARQESVPSREQWGGLLLLLSLTDVLSAYFLSLASETGD